MSMNSLVHPIDVDFPHLFTGSFEAQQILGTSPPWGRLHHRFAFRAGTIRGAVLAISGKHWRWKAPSYKGWFHEWKHTFAANPYTVVLWFSKWFHMISAHIHQVFKSFPYMHGGIQLLNKTILWGTIKMEAAEDNSHNSMIFWVY